MTRAVYHLSLFRVANRFEDDLFIVKKEICCDARDSLSQQNPLYTSRLLRVTTTYCVELTEPEFLDLKILFPIEEIGTRRGDRLKTVAEKIVDRYGTGLEGIGEVSDDLRQSIDIATDFDLDRFGEITIGGYTAGDAGGYTIADGNHRSIALAVLLHCGRVEYPNRHGDPLGEQRHR